MKAAIIGLMQSGKSTLVEAISGKKPPQIGTTAVEEVVAAVPDERINWLDGLYKPKKKVYATVDCLDVPGFSFTDEAGRAGARRYVNQIKTVDMLVLVVRAFEDDSVPAYRQSVDPVRDFNELQTEIILADLEQVSTRLDRIEEESKKPSKKLGINPAEKAVMEKMQEALEQERPIRDVIESAEEEELVRSFGFLTQKPMIVVVNTGEDDAGAAVELGAKCPVVGLCAKLEAELAQLDDQSRAEFMSDLGIGEPAVNRFMRSCYEAMGLVSFLTVGSDEVRAWPIERGTSAHDAAGKIHSDIKRGFIRAETMSYEDLKELGDEKAVKAAGKARLEGKTYVVQDGDIINFRFNV